MKWEGRSTRVGLCVITSGRHINDVFWLFLVDFLLISLNIYALCLLCCTRVDALYDGILFLSSECVTHTLGRHEAKVQCYAVNGCVVEVNVICVVCDVCVCVINYNRLTRQVCHVVEHYFPHSLNGCAYSV